MVTGIIAASLLAPFFLEVTPEVRSTYQSLGKSDMMTLFAYVEQYEVIGSDERRINGESTYRCAHNDWTHGGVGMRLSF